MTSAQTPLHDARRATLTALDALGDADLSGKTAIVTGGYSGIGLEATKALAHAGARVIVPARNPDKAREALAAIDACELARIDLIDAASIRSFVDAFLASRRALHLLINNAGVMAVPSLERDADGNELHLSANHLGHYRLTVGLWDALQRAQGARVVTLSSGAHRRSAFDFDDPNFDAQPYDKWQAYARSKTANVLFTVALDRRGEQHGIRAFAVHPGRIETDLQRFIPLAELQALGFRDEHGAIPADQRDAYKTVEQGAATTVWCATSAELREHGGVYCEDCDIARAVPADHSRLDGVLPWAIDPEAAERLWQWSERRTGVAL
ncbi:oxidoreductase [Burkholderia vietnamiensis]|jgi:NAD(P)-dependent dehydrogenase (short-subunit alcohol dehydrogenase family)|uniref:oxidoreductase n=1 Tax=Burkholderia vietnamiensis TaxID=60552 RepID=UPI0007589446|nr:oxidoreductase [Burkholderia vietnamiensis]TPQ31448.1 KR domain-containing protein [Burkholderia ubonensis]AOJ16653.1 oxidoreductase [Burkholderia vietnamiensis]KVE30183.1 oxidoreductase [Burkholderia vietnamiensis]KVE57095.1 oxidoreductase [Burkholderia vietnamiensis]KVE65929.1 oxidoreductase [Burkholderia vietnamiensis]